MIGLTGVRSQRLWLKVVSIVLLGSIASCAPWKSGGIDSWAHFEGGGSFDTNSPSLSPDGQFIAYASPCTGHGDIYSIKSGTHAPTRLTDSNDFESSPLFLADGSRIVFVREHANERHLWIMDADGSHSTQITFGNGIDSPSAVSRDGRYLLFSRGIDPLIGNGREAREYLTRIDRPTGDIIAVGDTAVLSQDSRLAVFSDKYQLWERDLASGKDRRIYGEGWPADLSPDAKLILVLRQSTSKAWNIDQEIWVLDTDAKSERQVAFGHMPIFFGKDRKNILFFKGFDSMPFVTTINGGEAKPIKCPPTYKTFPIVAWDGSGAVVGYFPPHARAEYGALFFTIDGQEPKNIAFFGCMNTTFDRPIVEPKP
jgi:Tol biopolymer transport system component